MSVTISMPMSAKVTMPLCVRILVSVDDCKTEKNVDLALSLTLVSFDAAVSFTPLNFDFAGVVNVLTK
jgi:hypothetical protein